MRKTQHSVYERFEKGSASSVKQKMRFSKYIAALLVCPTVLLTGCVGDDTSSGGGGETGSPPSTSDALQAYFLQSLDTVRAEANRLLNDDSRYQLQDTPTGAYADLNGNGVYDPIVDVLLNGSPLRHAGIHYAHAAGLTGAGEVIAISDAGFLTSHETLAGKTLTTGSNLLVDNHGTFVASVAAGNSDDMIGVAPEADLILGNFGSFEQLRETALSAASLGAVALNNSWGFDGLDATISDYSEMQSYSGAQSYIQGLETFAQDGIVLFAVSNDNENPTIGLMAGLPLLEPDLEDSWLAVVNGVPVMQDDDIVSARRVSGACLEAAAWCIAADGSWIGATAGGIDSYAFGTGTSYSAPLVAGALALLAEAFPTLTHQDLRVRLLATADNSFTGFETSGSVELADGFYHDYSDEWGHGFIDVAAALLPIGQPVVTLESGFELDVGRDPLAASGGASGDAVARALNGVEVVSLDAFSAPFAIEASSLVAQRSSAPLFSPSELHKRDRLKESSFRRDAFFGQGVRVPLQGGESDLEISYYNSSLSGVDSYGLGLSRTFDFSNASLQLSAGIGHDTANLLSTWNGSSSSTLFTVGMAYAANLSSSTSASFEVGYASGREASMLAQPADVLMNSATLSLSHRNAFTRNDTISISLSLPAAVTSGSTSLSLPTFSETNKIVYTNIPVSLAPERREMQLSLTYERPIASGATLGLTLRHAENQGNISGARDTGVLFTLNRVF
ncbi:S8 family peptidase [uncultured Aliiroseovarius sp.]|uniref:S8 family peptidase n=1 Tax=uncultured Aliiroseovarius sp. TaxID=1658783 RepID=UPI002633AEF8|nr:S8 family peptidase [uncultured Aliiroseovarius sp.]